LILEFIIDLIVLLILGKTYISQGTFIAIAISVPIACLIASVVVFRYILKITGWIVVETEQSNQATLGAPNNGPAQQSMQDAESRTQSTKAPATAFACFEYITERFCVEKSFDEAKEKNRRKFNALHQKMKEEEESLRRPVIACMHLYKFKNIHFFCLRLV
jgi:hypothetical protein